jgi:hypothetical protein
MPPERDTPTLSMINQRSTTIISGTCPWLPE